MGVVWLTSYPKSGNTWTRALLSAYFREDGNALALDKLGAGAGPRSSLSFDEHLGLEVSLLRLDEVELYHPDVALSMHESSPTKPRMIKVHSANTRNRDERWLFPAEAGRAIYVVRNPLDVAASLAPFLAWTLEHTADVMADEGYILNNLKGRPSPMFPERLLSWSSHVRSWLDGGGPPVHLVRYEDLHADTPKALWGMLAFIGAAPDPVRVDHAVAQARFERLQAAEEAHGFTEHSPVARTPFFRRGRAGTWREELPPALAQRLVQDHREMMLRLGYASAIEEAEALVELAPTPES